MLSSSGTEEESAESDYDDKRVKGESLKKLTASKFKPLGAGGDESSSPARASHENAPEEVDENGHAAEAHEHKELAEASEKQAKSGIAAAGFKQSLVKKSISIKIKGSENMGESEVSVTAEQTRLLKENKHISKKRSQQNFEGLDAKKEEQKAKEARKCSLQLVGWELWCCVKAVCSREQ